MQQSELASRRSDPSTVTLNSSAILSLEQGGVASNSALGGLSDSPVTANLSARHLAALIVTLFLALTSAVLSAVGTSFSSAYSSCGNSVTNVSSSYPPSYLQYIPELGVFGYRNGDDCWVPDLVECGVEPNPGPNIKLTLASRKAKKALRKAPAKQQSVHLTNSAPIQQTSNRPRQKGRGLRFMTGEEWNPRSDMIGYYQTLSDPERYPPVRLGGETMVQTALTTLHQVFAVGLSTANTSIVIHPRVWQPILVAGTGATPYAYASSLTYNSSSVTTLQSLAAAARVVSCKVKVYTTASATQDNGSLVIGLCPRDPGFIGSAAASQNTLSNTTANATNTASNSGYPIVTQPATAVATQGFNEFASEDWTDTTPLKDGASCFWLPQDPDSFVFKSDRIRQSTELVTGSQIQNASEIVDPFFCIGVSGSTTSTVLNVEVFLNLEYVVTAGASNVVETKAGAMSSIDSMHIVRRLGGNLQNTVEPDPESSLGDKFMNLGKSILKSGAERVSQFIFGSSDVGKAVVDLVS